MKKLLITLGVFLTFAACSRGNQESLPTDTQTLTIEVRFGTPKEILAACKAAQGGDCRDGLQGFAGELDGRCVVYVPHQTRKDDDQTLTLGHEVKHCLFGKFH